MTTLTSRAAQRRTASSARVAGLDGLRGLAAAFVVLHHVYLLAYPGYPAPHSPWWCRWLVYGHFAVAVFIVLSGFSLALRPARSDWRIADLGQFFRRRAWRILPTYWPALLFSLVIAWTITPQPEQGVPGLRSALVHGLLLQDIVGSATPNGAMWSIAVEVQLYLVFPLLVLLVRRLGAVAMLAIVTALVVGEGIAADHLRAAEQLLRLTPQFGALFALGVAAAAVRQRAPRPRLLAGAAVAALAPPVALITFRGSRWVVANLYWVDLALAPAIALGIAAVAGGAAARTARLLDRAPLRRLGGFSYTLYLVHAPIVVALFHLVVTPWAGTGTDALAIGGLGVAPIAVAVAWLFAEVFEFPFTRSGSWPAFRDRYVRSRRRRIGGK